jgi:hypothetical protein
MATWAEIQSEVERKFQIIQRTEEAITLGFEWDDGRSQPVTIQIVKFCGEEVLIALSPIVPYSKEAADFLLRNVGMPLKMSADGNVSVAHSMHIETMQVGSCLAAIVAVAETADEIEKSVTNGGDAGLDATIGGTSSENNEQSTDGVISSGQYVVGTDIQPGLYRFAGYVARLDSGMGIITNESVNSGLGLVLVNQHDAYFEVNGEAVPIANYPVYDVLENNPRGGIYLVGVDIPAGRYRIHGDGRSAYYETYDKTMKRINNDLNSGSLILSLGPGTFAMSFTGRLERL